MHQNVSQINIIIQTINTLIAESWYRSHNCVLYTCLILVKTFQIRLNIRRNLLLVNLKATYCQRLAIKQIITVIARINSTLQGSKTTKKSLIVRAFPLAVCYLYIIYQIILGYYLSKGCVIYGCQASNLIEKVKKYLPSKIRKTLQIVEIVSNMS